MKISKETRRNAKRLFRGCLPNGQIDENRLKATVEALVENKPRHYLAILAEIEKLLRIELQKRTLSIESATPLDASKVRDIESRVQSRFPYSLHTTHRVNPALIGGLRIQVGSDVWDGSIAARLQQLKTKN